MKPQSRILSRTYEHWCNNDFDREALMCRYPPKPHIRQVDPNLPFLNMSFRRNLASSLAYLLESSRISNVLWGDILHEVHGGQIALPHVRKK